LVFKTEKETRCEKAAKLSFELRKSLEDGAHSSSSPNILTLHQTFSSLTAVETETADVTGASDLFASLIYPTPRTSLWYDNNA
jgi:hypothetical protein